MQHTHQVSHVGHSCYMRPSFSSLILSFWEAAVSDVRHCCLAPCLTMQACKFETVRSFHMLTLDCVGVAGFSDHDVEASADEAFMAPALGWTCECIWWHPHAHQPTMHTPVVTGDHHHPPVALARAPSPDPRTNQWSTALPGLKPNSLKLLPNSKLWNCCVNHSAAAGPGQGQQLFIGLCITSLWTGVWALDWAPQCGLPQCVSPRGPLQRYQVRARARVCVALCTRWVPRTHTPGRLQGPSGACMEPPAIARACVEQRAGGGDGWLRWDARLRGMHAILGWWVCTCAMARPREWVTEVGAGRDPAGAQRREHGGAGGGAGGGADAGAAGVALAPILRRAAEERDPADAQPAHIPGAGRLGRPAAVHPGARALLHPDVHPQILHPCAAPRRLAHVARVWPGHQVVGWRLAIWRWALIMHHGSYVCISAFIALIVEVLTAHCLCPKARHTEQAARQQWSSPQISQLCRILRGHSLKLCLAQRTLTSEFALWAPFQTSTVYSVLLNSLPFVRCVYCAFCTPQAGRINVALTSSAL